MEEARVALAESLEGHDPEGEAASYQVIEEGEVKGGTSDGGGLTLCMCMCMCISYGSCVWSFCVQCGGGGVAAGAKGPKTRHLALCPTPFTSPTNHCLSDRLQAPAPGVGDDLVLDPLQAPRPRLPKQGEGPASPFTLSCCCCCCCWPSTIPSHDCFTHSCSSDTGLLLPAQHPPPVFPPSFIPRSHGPFPSHDDAFLPASVVPFSSAHPPAVSSSFILPPHRITGGERSGAHALRHPPAGRAPPTDPGQARRGDGSVF